MDAHLEAVPGLGTLTARGLAGGDLEALGGQADGTLGAEVLVLSAVDDLSADLLEDLDLAGGQGDADLVALLYIQQLLVNCIIWKYHRGPSSLAQAGTEFGIEGKIGRTGASPRSLSALLYDILVD